MRLAIEELLALAILVLGSAGCHSDAGKGVVSDGVGPDVIQNPSRDAAPNQWVLGPEPLHDWGGLQADPADEFEHRNGYLKGMLRPDGSLVVIDRFRVREFASSGREIARSGQPGSGPSEFRGLSTICRFVGDTIAVYDPLNARLSLIAPGGKIVHEALIGDEGVLLDAPCPGDASVVIQRSNGSLVRLDRDGQVVGELGSAPRARTNDGMPTAAFVATYAEKLYTAASNVPEYRVRSLDGAESVQVRFDEQPSSGTGTEGGQGAQFDSPNASRRAEVEAEMRRAQDEANRYRYFDRLLVGETGVWLRTARPPRSYNAPEVWTLFSHRGELQGQLTIPAPPYDGSVRDAQGRPPAPPFRPILMQVGDSTALILRYDDDGAAHFSVYPLVESD